MPKYLVKSHLTHDGQEYPPGSEVTLTEEQAALIPWAIEKREEQSKRAAQAHAPREAKGKNEK